MAFNVTGLKRVFKIKIDGKDIKLTDPDTARTPEQVMAFYENQYPELVNATVIGPEIAGTEAVYEFKTTLGTKG